MICNKVKEYVYSSISELEWQPVKLDILVAATVAGIMKSNLFLGAQIGVTYAVSRYVWSRVPPEEMSQNLHEWCDEKNGTPEHAKRLEAAKEIKDCYISRSNELNLSAMGLTSLPNAIGQLTNLKWLYLCDNQLAALPDRIGQLTRLKQLHLSGNRLTTLPNRIGRLIDLEVLSLSGNQLTALFDRIGQLIRLKRLYLSGNRLAALPLSAFNLRDDCEIDITNCPFSNEVLRRIRDTVASSGYNGPRISYSVYEPREVDERSTQEILEGLVSRIEYEPKDFSFLSDLSPEWQDALTTWLQKLSSIADFKHGGKNKTDLAKKVLEYLDLVKINPSFREQFFSIINGVATTCGDRMALSIVHLGIAKSLATMDLNQTEMLANFLIRTVWAIEQLEKMARTHVEHQRFVDEIEVYLGYFIKLKERLNLSLDIKEMLYFRCSNLSHHDLNQAAEEILTKRQSMNEQAKFLSGNAHWRKALQNKYPTEYATALNSEDMIGALESLTKSELSSFAQTPMDFYEVKDEKRD